MTQAKREPCKLHEGYDPRCPLCGIHDQIQQTQAKREEPTGDTWRAADTKRTADSLRAERAYAKAKREERCTDPYCAAEDASLVDCTCDCHSRPEPSDVHPVPDPTPAEGR